MTYDGIKKILSAAGIGDASFEAALLLRKFCGVNPAQLPLLKSFEYDCLELTAAVEKRAERYPLQYIIGEWGFCGESYEVSPGCLIPRADTELLVLTAAALIPYGGRFIDAGTGSGCISVSLLVSRADLSGVSFDISNDALEIAGGNAEHAGVLGRLSLKHGNMLDESFWRGAGVFDAVISNPPYIPSGEIKSLEPELGFEPVGALDGGVDGLDFYRGIIKNAGCALSECGVILLEVGYGEAGDVSSIARENGYMAETINDIEGRGRVVVLRKNNT